MKINELNMMNIMSLQAELEEAIDSYHTYLEVGDINLANMWYAIIEQICKDIRNI